MSIAAAKSRKVQRERADARALIQLTARRWWAPALHHSPNEELHPLARQLAAAEGTRPGFPDYVLILRSGPYAGAAMELKAPKPHGGRPTTRQRAWLDHFASQGWKVGVCYGVEDACAFLDQYVALGAERPK